MKLSSLVAAAALLLAPSLMAQNGTSFTNFIRQVQIEAGKPESQWVEWDLQNIPASGEALSPLAIDPGGARFELWTVKATNPPTQYLLDSRYVGTYVPIAQVVIRSEDPYPTIPRTRADRPFYVDVTVDGLLTDASAPDGAKSINLLHHIQSYGTNGTGVGINRTQATLQGTRSMTQNGQTTYTYAINNLPGANRAKIRGEERFSAFSVPDYQAPSSQLASQFIQIWPVADGAISGITDNQHIRTVPPPLTFAVNDVYPGSSVYAQAYKGSPVLGKVGVVIPGSAKNYHSQTVPVNHLEAVSDYESVLNSDGRWTIELLTETPFGLERLHYVTFTLDRTIQMNGSVTTITD
ncbi:hypothetical protein OKA04_17865 [Luteolibacter flavescens]|uniref:Uncharacterized protein n=1 Tax=Luteolibacter flavescens TaxID=1859460 RepID=A0ABT3FSQ5_9BACT|nr:hypothetical protein [Luteolibacter flavescens]MCW1886610.1 hypothetical protein [Luteolibacter flavescens]